MAINPVLNGALNFNTNQITTSTTALLMAPPRNTRRAVAVYNTGSANVFVGGKNVSSTTGYLILPGAFVSIPTVAEMWVVGSAAGSVSVMEIFD